MVTNFFENNTSEKLQKETDKREANSLWCEKYRPLTLDDYVGNKLLKEKVKRFIEEGDIPHLLLHGKAGGGKTTLAKILVNNINCDYIYINASDENSVDNVRDKIKGFASSVAFRDIKIIILDEADFLTTNAQAALRNIMETFSKTTRFVLTCNYVERILDAISSRCQTFEVVPPSKGDVAKRLAVDILTKEGITYENTDIKLLIDSHYPDIRKIINTAQKHSIDGKLQIDKKEILESDFKLKIIDILKETKSKSQKFTEIRQLIADNGVSHFEDIYKLLYDNMTEYGKGKIASIIVLLAEMEYKSAFVVDKEINFMSAIVQLLEILYGGN
jgi:replication factor C small subunit